MSKNPKSSANPAFGPKNANVSNYVHRFAQKNPFAIAVISDGKAASFETLNGYVWNAVHRLEKAGLEAGATAGFRFNDQFLHLVFVLAALRRGNAHISIYAGWPDRLANGLAKQAGADIIFADQEWPNGDAETHTVSLNSLTKQSATADISLRDVADDVPIVFSLGSGTTGKQRIICYDIANLGAMIRRDLRVRPIGFQKRFYSMVLFNYFTGKRRTLGCLAAGGTVVFKNKTGSVAAMCDRLGVDHLSLVVSHAVSMVNYFKTDRPRLPKLKSLVIGSSPISEDLRNRLRKCINANLFIGYGTNEFGEAAFASAKVQRAHPGTVGMPSPGVEIKIVGSNGDRLPAGETGEVLLRAEGMFSGYLGEPEATAAAFRDGWYRPGDLGSLTADGALMYMGRTDDLMIRDGINIYPREIESVLESHAGVVEAAAFPLDSAKNWQLPVATVTVRDASLTPRMLKQFCFDSIGPKMPEYIWIIDDMPRNEAGKIRKNDLVKYAMKALRQ